MRLTEIAKARGLALADLLDTLVQESAMQPIGQPRTGEELLRFLGADDAEIAASVEDASDED